MSEYMVKYFSVEKSEVKGPLRECLQGLETDGYYIWPNFFDHSTVNDLRRRIEIVWEKQKAQFGEQNLKNMGEHGVARSLIEYDWKFAELLAHPKLNEILAVTVGSTAILNLMNGILLQPQTGHPQRRLHRDFAKDFTASKILSLNTFVMLDDFTKDNGSTEYLPGTHKDERLPTEAEVEKNIVSVVAPKGSVLVFDSLLLHRAGVNTTGDVRVGLNMQFTRPFIKQQIDYPRFLKPQMDPDGLIAQRLGYWSVAPRGVAEYRVTDPKLRTYRSGQG